MEPIAKNITILSTSGHTYVVKVNNIVYSLNLTLGDKTVNLNIKKPLSAIKYEGIFTLDELKKMNLIFTFKKEIKDIFDLIRNKILNGKIYLTEDDRCINMELYFELDSNKEVVVISIPQVQGEVNINEIIDDLSVEIVKLGERVKYLETATKQKNNKSEVFKNSTIVRQEDDSVILNWLGVQGKNYEFNLLIRASDQGFDSSVFHTKCDNKGANIVFVESTQGFRFGGYTTLSWDQSGQYKNDANAFLFSITRDMKMKIKNLGNAIYCNASYCPTFGSGHDFYIATDSNKAYNSYSNGNHGYSIENTEINARSFLAGSYNFCAKDYEVYSVKLT